MKKVFITCISSQPKDNNYHSLRLNDGRSQLLITNKVIVQLVTNY